MSVSAKMRKEGGIHTFVAVLRRIVSFGSAGRQAAALPWRSDGRGGTEVMLVTTRESGRWVLPKGWPESGEPLSDAAAREAFEEAGLHGIIAADAIGRYTYYKTRGSRSGLRCKVFVYPLKVEQVVESWPEREQRRRAWFAPAEAASRVEQPRLAGLLQRFSPPRTLS